jgi:hypothetical protein
MTGTMASVAIGVAAACGLTFQPSSAQTTAQTAAQTTTQTAANECLARPGGAPPRGSHWYYRIDRQTRRKCWYLGAANLKVRRAAPVERSEPERVAAPVPAPRPDPRDETRQPDARQVETRPELRAAEPRADEQRPNAQPVERPAPTSSADTSAIAAPQFSAAWPSLPNGMASSEVDMTATAPATAGAADNADTAALNTQPEETPTAQPALSAAERATMAQGSDSAPGLAQLLIFLAAAAAFVGLAFRMIFKLSSRWRRRERRLPARRAAPIIRQRVQEPPARSEPSFEEMAEPTIARLREIAKRWDAPTRVPRQPRLPAYEVESDYQAETTKARRRAVA